MMSFKRHCMVSVHAAITDLWHLQAAVGLIFPVGGAKMLVSGTPPYTWLAQLASHPCPYSGATLCVDLSSGVERAGATACVGPAVV
jgi:hypothetical protein